jgi:hypothetical protein
MSAPFCLYAADGQQRFKTRLCYELAPSESMQDRHTIDFNGIARTTLSKPVR